MKLSVIGTAAAVLAVGVIATGAMGAIAQMKTDGKSSDSQSSGKEIKVTELKIEDQKVGDGAEAKAGHTVTVHYTGTLTDGHKFDSSKDRNQPFKFKLGAGQVIKGWDQGVAGMKIGGIRKLTIPAELGYGARSAGSIPPNSVLVFEVELLGVEEKA